MGRKKNFLKILKDKNIENPKFKYLIIENAYKSGCYDRTILKELEKILNLYSIEDLALSSSYTIRCLIENMAFSHVGIFCVSHLKVFCDDPVQLMFAHYADNLKGLALIYDVPETTFKKIEYINDIKGSSGTSDRWKNGSPAIIRR